MGFKAGWLRILFANEKRRAQVISDAQDDPNGIGCRAGRRRTKLGRASAFGHGGDAAFRLGGMKAIWHLSSLAVCTMVALCAFAEGAVFGPTVRTNASPKKLWEIRSEQDNKHEGAYSLILRNRKTGAERQIFRGGRWCEVVWSADDSRIAITDWWGSNSSEIRMLIADRKEPAKPLADAAARAYLTSGEAVGHCYWEALKWEPDGRLRIRAFGHTDENPPHEFAYEFIFDPVKKSATLVKKESGVRSRAEQKIWASKEKAWKTTPGEPGAVPDAAPPHR
jgi:hypothetical protein